MVGLDPGVATLRLGRRLLWVRQQKGNSLAKGCGIAGWNAGDDARLVYIILDPGCLGYNDRPPTRQRFQESLTPCRELGFEDAHNYDSGVAVELAKLRPLVKTLGHIGGQWIG